MKNNLRSLKRQIAFLSVLTLGVSTYACDNNSKSKAAPAPAKNCPKTGGATLALQSTSTDLKVSYEKTMENGKEVTKYSIKKIIADNCISCHQSGEDGAEYPLGSYSNAKSHGKESTAQLKAGKMPPGKASVAKTLLPYYQAWEKAGFPQNLTSNASSTGTKTSTSTSTNKTTPDDDDDNNDDDTKTTGSTSNTNSKVGTSTNTKKDTECNT